MLPGSIRGKLLALVLAAVVPCLALMGGGLWYERQETEAAAKQRALNDARVLAAQVDDHIGNLEHLLAGLSRAVSTDPADVKANDALFRRVRSELPSFISGISLFSPAGENIGTSWDPARRKDNNDRLPFRQILAGQRLAIGEVHVGGVTRRWVVNLARRVEDEAGRLRAVLIVGTRLEQFQDALRIDALAPGSVVRIVNEHGVVVAQSLSGPNWIGRDLADHDAVARHLAAKEASERETWSDGVERFTGSSTAHRVPWLVSVGLPPEAVFAAVAANLRWSALLSSLALASAFFIAWVLSGRMVRPLQQLEKDASVLAAGALDHRTAVRGRDEVGKLAEAFNRMAVSLEKRQEEVQQASDTLAAVIDASPVAISCCDLERRVVLWNRSAEQIYGYTAQEAIGRPAPVIPSDAAEESFNLYRRALGGETIRDVEIKRVRKDGSLIHVRLAAAPMHSRDGSVRGVAWAVEDITDRKRADEQLQRLAHYDPLTGLPNRLSLQKELGRLLADAAQGTPTGLALFDLDDFKDVNDTLGHSVGDQLLMEIGQRLIRVRGNSGSAGRVFRLGGDEFVVVVPDCGDPCLISEIVGAMLGHLAQPFKLGDHTLHVGGSAGVAIAPNDGHNVDDLIANADLVLYQAKTDGGGICRHFQPVLRAQAQARRALDVDLRRAFAENELDLFFQPQIRMADGAIVGAEALLRWRHPQRGLLAPGAFIEILAKSAIAPQVGRWIIRAACERMSCWHACGFSLERVAVNLFPAQLQDDGLLRDIQDALQRSGLPPRALELEITENVALDWKNATEPLQKLCAQGVKLAFDDFGTGYASLSYLTRLPLSRIKIDRSFVRRITEGGQDAAIVRSLIAMAHNLDLAVIAEGVETEEQAVFLRDECCEEAQGFLYAAPLPANDFEEYLRRERLAREGLRSASRRMPDVTLQGAASSAAGHRKARAS
jgi:diguanylate cyclase (GGDEF)-like protein/PAS domain S-box-containing protein